MQAGEYITERFLPKAVKAACEKYSIEYESFSDEWVLRLQKGPVSRMICGDTFGLNSASAANAATDKVAAYSLLSAFGIAAVPHVLIRSTQSKKPDVSAVQRSFAPDQTVVIKPLTGQSGRGVIRLNAATDIPAFIRNSNELAWAASPMYDLHTETRIVMLDGEILLAYEKYDPYIRDGLKLFNLRLGTKAKIISYPDNEVISLAVKAAEALDLRLAAVDIAATETGEYLILEVNQSISMEHFARQSEEHERQAFAAYERIVARMFE